MTTTRDAIIDAASSLLEERGYFGTGLSQILAASGTPKGSLYHYFPDGKDGLAAEAIARAGLHLAERIRLNLAGGGDPAQAVRRFVRRIATAVEESGFKAGGGPLQIVALETASTNERLNLACRDAYLAVQNAFANRLRVAGLDEAQASGLAELVVSVIEGATVLSRTHHSGAPLRRAADYLAQVIAAAAPARA